MLLGPKDRFWLRENHHLGSMGLKIASKSFKMLPKRADPMKMTSRNVKKLKFAIVAIFVIYGVDFPPVGFAKAELTSNSWKREDF